MMIYPAIDLKDGKAVRLERGEMSSAKIFSNNPVEQAILFQKQGFRHLHLVDLNGAFAGKSMNGDIVRSIIKTISIPVQLGGGIRTEDDVKYWLDLGVACVIIGTMLIRDFNLAMKCFSNFSGKVIAGIDAIDGKVATDGWAVGSDITATSLAKKIEDSGAAAIIYTDVKCDGMMKGPNIAETKKLADATNLQIIASGGVSSIKDLEALKIASNNITGAIVGRAIYDNAITAELLSRNSLLQNPN